MTESSILKKVMTNGHVCDYMESVDYDALADRCLSLLEQREAHHSKLQSSDNFDNYHQIFIGIAGTPGSGKSFIAENVANAIQKKNPNSDPTREECVVVGMDGYHFTRSQIKQKVERGDKFKTDEDGKVEYKQLTYEQVMARRGAGFTYCPKKFIADLRQAKEAGHGSFPIYDREQHDPVSDGIVVKSYHKIILVEGLYLLCLHDPDWEPLNELWDEKWYIDVSMEETKRRLVERHMKHWDESKTKRWGGNDEAAATRKAEANDLKNAVCIKKMSKDKADLIIRNETILEDDTNNPDVEAAEET